MSETKQVWKELIRFDKDIQFIARAVAFEWPKATTEEDLAQEMYIRLAETPASVDKLKELDRRSRLGWLKRIAEQIASIERTDYDHFSGNYCYSSNEVRKALENGVLTQHPTKVNPISVDIHEALPRLSEKNREIIAAKFVNRDYDGYRVYVTRAVDKLTELMNRASHREKHEYHDGPGSRKAISNSAAQRIATQQYENRVSGGLLRSLGGAAYSEDYHETGEN